MTNVLIFNVSIEGLEDKIWRNIEITDKRTVGDLAYTILASFDSLAYHLYEIEYKNDKYKCGYAPENGYCAHLKKLSNLNINVGDNLIMNYDMGSTTTFNIKCIGCREIERGNGTHYPYITDGKGHGMTDDISSEELITIVEDIDKKGYSDYNYTPGYKRKINYDYRDYNIINDNILLKGMLLKIKNGYEVN